jgi:hypothetical protein
VGGVGVHAEEVADHDEGKVGECLGHGRVSGPDAWESVLPHVVVNRIGTAGASTSTRATTHTSPSASSFKMWIFAVVAVAPGRQHWLIHAPLKTKPGVDTMDGRRCSRR